MVQVNRTLPVQYRPKKLDSVVGQTQAIATLKGMLKSKKVTPTYLFYGPSGVGKTTVARILAHSINCENFNYETSAPCFQCEYCEGVKKNVYADVQELNFSETRGIETIRSVIDDTAYEASSNAKIYILDEMHNMTSQAQNAFLKSLEEPPENVIFILLTSEPRKVIPALRNRCMEIPFFKVNNKLVYKLLYAIAKREQKEVPEYALKHITLYANGDVRLAVQTLDKVFLSMVSQSDLDLNNQEHLLKLVGANQDTDLLTLADFLIKGLYTARYTTSVVATQTLLKNDGLNLRTFFNQAIEFHIATIQFLADPKKQTSIHSDYYQDWYATLQKSVEENTFFLSSSSGGEVLALLLELYEKLKMPEVDESKLVLSYILKMTECIRSKIPHSTKELASLKEILGSNKA